jgi:hypothetical protein
LACGVRSLTTYIDLACNEQCLTCGVSFTVIREYIIHFQKCRKKIDPRKNKSVLKAAQGVVHRLQNDTRQKLDELHESRKILDIIEGDSEASSRKRKVDSFKPPSQRRCIQVDNSTLMLKASFAQAEATASRSSMNYATDTQTQLSFPFNSTPHPIDASWNTYGTGNNDSSLGNVSAPIMYTNLEEDLGSLGGIQTQYICPNAEDEYAGFDAPILRMISAPQHGWNPR